VEHNTGSDPPGASIVPAVVAEPQHPVVTAGSSETPAVAQPASAADTHPAIATINANARPPGMSLHPVVIA